MPRVFAGNYHPTQTLCWRGRDPNPRFRSAAEGPMVRRLSAGGRWIRTFSTAARKSAISEASPGRGHFRLRTGRLGLLALILTVAAVQTVGATIMPERSRELATPKRALPPLPGGSGVN